MRKLCPFASKDEPVSSLFPSLVCAVSGLSFDCRRLSASYSVECIHHEREEGIKTLQDKLRPRSTASLRRFKIFALSAGAA